VFGLSRRGAGLAVRRRGFYAGVMAEDPERGGKSGFIAFWTTLPGILTGLAALITALVAVVGLWRSQSGGDSSVTTTGADTTTVVTRSSDGSTTPGGVDRGRLTLARGDSADLEQNQIGSSPNADVTFGPETTPTLHALPPAFLAPAPAEATRALCTRELSSRRDSSEIVSQLPARALCVSTVEGHVAAVRVVQVPGVGNAKLVIDYTVWP
jgi:hypothetical protein